jgi:hypothetical protein
MLPGTYDLQLYRGDTTRFRFTLWSDDAKTVPLDLSSASVSAQIRDQPDDTTVLVTLSCAVTPPNNIDVTVPTASAGALPAVGVWDLEITWADGDIQTVLAGAVYTAPDVTRP